MGKNVYQTFTSAVSASNTLLAILIDPDVFEVATAAQFLRKLPAETTHIFVGGSSVPNGKTSAVVTALKSSTAKPIVLFPGNVSQICKEADAILFLNLLSGRNPEYLIGQHIKAVPKLRHTSLEVISTGYILIDGGNKSAVARVTATNALPQDDIQHIVDIAKAGELLGAKLMYLEAGSGAKVPVSEAIISAVKNEISIPLIVGGGIKTEIQKQIAYKAGATMVVMGTHFEVRSASNL
ncbi:geranylgeranylglyceryl/heptaprenylglyceryl phosphate synthase [Rasiella rasia]|uniref:Geranylgeranylglyceryl phosphate synthase n=2 Tax=Rasiella rasia TaxID=2744027 RepID=A0A6G6GQN4_9FLAO|nr:geranylgeranylglyceryl/heptaprenylglyceryl phosphate synthase [Rasiella rasia]